MFLFLTLTPAAAGAGGSAEAPECLGPSCHSLPTSSSESHPQVRQGHCTACHKPEEGFFPELHGVDSFDREFAARPACLMCHVRIKEMAESSPFLHDPFREGPCTACHLAHRSSAPPLLRDAFPPSVYSSFDRSVYALCWECHDSSLATDKFSARATEFRLGSRNFHFSHLQKRKGMTCRACHLAHGGPQPLLVRDVPPEGFTGWIDRMNFRKGPSGGRCMGGCHKDISYRR